MKEVKRKAEVGEYIRITNVKDPMGRYDVGTIMHVADTWSCWVYVDIYNPGYGRLIHDDEYVVLEDYQPDGE